MLASFCMARAGVLASFQFHATLLLATLHARPSHHDTTPKGRTLNRFADDLSTLDLVLPFTLRSCLNCALVTSSTVVVVALTSSVLFLLPASLFAFVYFYVQVRNKSSQFEIGLFFGRGIL